MKVLSDHSDLTVKPLVEAAAYRIGLKSGCGLYESFSKSQYQNLEILVYMSRFKRNYS